MRQNPAGHAGPQQLRQVFMNLVENAKDGKLSVDANGAPKADNTYWKGFPARTAVGLRLEQRKP